MTRTVVVEHLGRIEGHAGVTVTIEDGRVDRVEFDVFEGIRLFEGLVRGRPVKEIGGIVSRICAICSHSHVITALQALERALAVEVSPGTQELRELAFHGTAIESHALHVFCLALPDFFHRASVIELAETAPDTVAIGLRLKKLGNTIQEIVGGRAVHPVTYALGGFAHWPSRADLLRLRADLATGVNDCARALEVLQDLEVPAIGRDPIRCAAVAPDSGSYFFGREIRVSDGPPVPVDEYRSLASEQPVPHSTAKQSRAGGRQYMVGALARLSLNGDAITGPARDVCRTLGLDGPCRNVVRNNLAQFVEIVFSIDRALALVDHLLAIPGPPPRTAPSPSRAGRGAAATEVPRGTLVHSYEIDAAGRVAAADVITPTAQNCAHLEQQVRAAVEEAPGLPDDELRRRIEMIVRAYDPCVSCSVHVVRAGSRGTSGARRA